MYLRYFLWNYAGRQKRCTGLRRVEDGNWLTGIPLLIKMRLGHDQLNLPDSKKNWGTNSIHAASDLGLIGLFFRLKRIHTGLLITMLFIMTGLAIVVYLKPEAF